MQHSPHIPQTDADGMADAVCCGLCDCEARHTEQTWQRPVSWLLLLMDLRQRRGFKTEIEMEKCPPNAFHLVSEVGGCARVQLRVPWLTLEARQALAVICAHFPGLRHMDDLGSSLHGHGRKRLFCPIGLMCVWFLHKHGGQLKTRCVVACTCHATHTEQGMRVWRVLAVSCVCCA